MTDRSKDRAANQRGDNDRHSASAGSWNINARLIVDSWAFTRGLFGQFHVPEPLKDVMKGDECLVVEQLPFLLQSGVLLGRSLRELLVALVQALTSL
ncbi:hypothetical protein AQJ11_32730 [Streptomyces corchorusii]|uniref:Uncharacterized protein n=1 Tax=Streptomyces corchorusii TaxID=1903 RepID=A0A124HK93_STRCK|nr:hypothetical protein AQJ11_32730 [Streptomyces corchorusii]